MCTDNEHITILCIGGLLYRGVKLLQLFILYHKVSGGNGIGSASGAFDAPHGYQWHGVEGPAVS